MHYFRLTAVILIMVSKLTLFSATAIGAAGTPVPAVITGFSAFDNVVEFVVISTGCTHRDDFILDHHVTAEGHTSVTLLRTRPDHVVVCHLK